MLITKPQKLKTTQSNEIPFFSYTVQAGFPSPAEDMIEKNIDLNRILINHPEATYFVRVQGDSMKNAGIFQDDVMIVDKSLNPKSGDVVIASINGEFTVKTIGKINGKTFLFPSNPKYQPIPVDDCEELQIWGIVTYVIHKV